MGGFSGSVPEPTLAKVKQLVATGQLRFFMLGGDGGFAGPGGLAGQGVRGGGETAQIDAWVQSSCHTVQVSGADSTGTLYQCGARRPRLLMVQRAGLATPGAPGRGRSAW